MQRTFSYSFVPASADPVGSSVVSLSVSEIEDAGLREILQTPGAALGSWALFDALLEPTGAGTPFVFREPLGQAREVKVALSGLFGRFVARAYLERYFDLSVFAHLGQRSMLLDGKRRISVVRRLRGDLPDWVACSSALTDLTIAEAKGCHDRPGPAKALARAWTQTSRIRVTCKGAPVTTKRVAVATRWASTSGGSAVPALWVHDPEEIGEPISPEDHQALFVGLLRRQIAELALGLGHRKLADAMMRLTSTRQRGDQARAAALQAMETANAQDVGVSAAEEAIDGLLGGVVTRQGPIANRRLSLADERVLLRLDLRPVFVGLEREVVRLAIAGEPEPLRLAMKRQRGKHQRARYGGAGGWVVPLDGD